MITIVKGKEKIICSYGTYEDQYKQLGYLPASKTEKEATKKIASSLKEKENNEEEINKISTKYGIKKKTTIKKEEQ